MNAQNAHLFLPLVQALADGKTIQFKTQARGWEDIKAGEQLDLSFDPDIYRIKPELPKPREFRMWVAPNGEAAVPFRLDEKLPRRCTDAGWVEIKVREVIPEP